MQTNNRTLEAYSIEYTNILTNIQERGHLKWPYLKIAAWLSLFK